MKTKKEVLEKMYNDISNGKEIGKEGYGDFFTDYGHLKSFVCEYGQALSDCAINYFYFIDNDESSTVKDFDVLRENLRLLFSSGATEKIEDYSIETSELSGEHIFLRNYFNESKFEFSKR